MFAPKKMAASVALIAATTLPAVADIDASSEQLIADFLQKEGYQAKLEVLDDGEPVIRSSEAGSDFSIYFYDCTNGTNCKTIQFFTAYDLDNGMTMDQVNTWNREFRFGKVYLDDENDPFLEMDVNLDYGVSEGNFLDTLDWWTVVLGRFEEYIDW